MSSHAVDVILVTGLSGRSGRFLLAALEADPDFLESHRIRALVRTDAARVELESRASWLEVVVGDINDESSVRRAMSNVSIVLHIAGIQTSRTLATVAVESGVEWMVLVHTTGIYSKYKAAGEGYREIEQYVSQIAGESATKVTVLRPTMIYGSLTDGNVATFIKMVDRLRVFPVVSRAVYALQPVHQRDLGTAYLQVLKHRPVTEGRDYVLSGAEPILLIDMLKTISGLLGKKTTFVSVPFPVAYAGAVLLWVASLGRIDLREKVQRLVEPRAFPHDDARRDFGYSPVRFQEGVVNEVEQYTRER